MQKTVLVFLTALFLVSPAFPQSRDSPTAEGAGLRIVEKQYEDVSDSDRFEIKAVYPSIILDGDIGAVGFDAQAKSLVMSEVDRFTRVMKEFADDVDNAPDRFPYYLSVGYSTEHIDQNIVSVLFNISEFTGGAHPNHWTKTLNYDLRKKTRIELAGLFKTGTDYLVVISENSIASLLEQFKERSGNYADAGWVKEGAGPDAKNFESWNITKSGLKFHFDPYQVGAYAFGGFETIVPYRRFTAEIRSDGFYTAESSSFIDGDPPNICRGGLWTSVDAEFKLAKVLGRKNTRAHFFKDDGDCPDGENCRRSAYLIAGDEVIVQREFEGFSCVWFLPLKGAETVGWIRSGDLEIRPDVSLPSQSWVGTWKYGPGEIKIEETQSGKLHVYGTSYWQGMGDNVHIGEIDYFGAPENGSLVVGDGEDQYDCRVKIRLLGKYLIVSDNLNCGGVNVTFNGVYTRKYRRISI